MSTRPFTPSQERPEDLERRTVGRDRLLTVLDERMRLAATTKTRQHTILVGPRGAGKTHLLQVAIHRAEADPTIKAGLLIARIPEDAIGLTSYVDLLRELGRGLGVDVGLERSAGALEKALLDTAGTRTLALVIENLDKVFSAIGLAGQDDLRAWVETSGRVLILAATPALFDAVRNRKMPWFGGLTEMPVDGLTAEEGRQLLTLLATDRGDDKLAEALQSEWGKARIRAVSHLTDGSPRIWMVFSDCLSVDTLDELIPAVEGLIEGLVPYYQQLLWSLPGNQQAIVHQLAEGPSGALTASEIAVKTGLTPQTVTKALGLLKEHRWVRAMKQPHGDQRHTWYELRDPMLRHHLQWRSAGNESLRLTVGLLRNWYDPESREHLSTTIVASRHGAGHVAATPRVHQELSTAQEQIPDKYQKVLSQVTENPEPRSHRGAECTGTLELLDRARSGDQQARMRLPAELRPLVESGQD
ncbi:MAG: AAA family ATPase [Propionibacteriaceae bacterium]|nr:AAA family ATPase [Propionibacteriaceae bacterium]